MVNVSTPIMPQHQQAISAPLQQNFELDLSPNLLLQMMANYQLKASDITGNYSFSALLFEHLVTIQPCNNDAYLPEALLKIMRNWPKKLSWPQFNEQTYALLIAWLHDYRAGATLDAALVLVRSLALEAIEKNNVLGTTQFQSLLMHLISRTTHQFEQYRFSYVQNFDLDSGLPNQQLLINLLKQHLQDKTETSHLGLILVNLNINFDEKSQLNTSASNLMLAAIQTIQTHLHDDTTLFHVGPVELAILVKNLTFPTQLNLIASKLLHAFETPLPLMNMTLILAPYFGGISTFNTQSNAISLYENARLALHHGIIKNERLRFYDQQISSSFMNTHLLDEAIIDALQQNELAIYLQPIVSLHYDQDAKKTSTNENSSEQIYYKETCISAEVLLRWPNQEWQSISPIRLVETIYKKGFGKVFIRWLINNACRRSAELMTTHQRRMSLTINFGGADLLDEDLPELLAQSIALWEIPAKNLIIEVTESDLLIDEFKAAKVLDKIVALGCKLALDDFGTGYSSMARLRNMPIDFVKIDQSFVRNIETSAEDKKIVESIVTLAHSLGKEIVAEGVEDLACLNILKEMKCEKIQGYYYAKPMPFNEFIVWLNNFESLH